MKKLFTFAAFTAALFSGTQIALAQTSPTASPTPMMAPSPMTMPTPMMTASPMTMPAPMMSASPMSSPAPATSGSPSPSPSPSALPKLIQFSGFGDLGYTSRVGNSTTRFSNADSTGAPLGASYPSRVFDYYDRTPDLQNLNVQAALTAGNLSGKLELSAGTDADIIAAYPASYNGFDVTQAYLAYTLGKATLQAGKFETLAGAEVIESPSNLNFSRSILFGFAVPFTHTGGRLTYAVTPHLNIIGGVNAGWDEIRSTNGRLTAEYGFAFNPSAAASLTAQGYTGIEQLANYYNGYNPYVSGTGNQTPVGIPPSAQGQRSLIDVVGTVHPTSATTLTLNYDRGLQQNFTNFDGTTLTAGWSGLAGYASYQLNPRLVGSVRYEGFHDPQGYRTGILGGQFWREGTATLGYNLTSAVTLRAEYRHDTSDHAVFLTNGGNSLSKNNSTFGLEAFVKY